MNKFEEIIKDLERIYDKQHNEILRLTGIIKQAELKAEASQRVLNNWSVRINDICESALNGDVEVTGIDVLTEKSQHELNVAMVQAVQARIKCKLEQPQQ